jgi:hypothetical protein
MVIRFTSISSPEITGSGWVPVFLALVEKRRVSSNPCSPAMWGRLFMIRRLPR